MNWKFAVTGAFTIVLSVSTAIAEEGDSQGHPAPSTAVLYGFAGVSDLSHLAEGPVKDTCIHSAAPPAGTSANKTATPTEDEEAKLAAEMTKELARKLAKKMPVDVAPLDNASAEGSLVFTGCIVSAVPGNAAKRLVGMGLGASRLSAHVRVFYAGASGPTPVDEFDLSVKGRNVLPPLGPAGLAFNGVSERRETLRGDARRSADEILKKLKKDHPSEL